MIQGMGPTTVGLATVRQVRKPDSLATRRRNIRDHLRPVTVLLPVIPGNDVNADTADGRLALDLGMGR